MTIRKSKRLDRYVYSPTATKIQKKTISNQFESVIEELKKNLQPIPEPHIFNHRIDIFSKWRGNFFYIMEKFKTGENSTTEFFDCGIPRLEFYGEDRFNLSYFRHTGKWEHLFMYADISFETAKKAILEDSIFEIF